MLKALELFKQNIVAAKQGLVVYGYLTNSIGGPVDYGDLLRAQVVYAVSAFDKLMHDLIRGGMLQTYAGTRVATAKYLSESVLMDLHVKLISASIPPAAFLLEQALFTKFKALTFQEPGKVADGLSYIWNESNKWQKIAAAMQLTEASAKTELKLIVDRRNDIVHEADIDPLLLTKRPLTESECVRATEFLAKCGEAIANLVI